MVHVQNVVHTAVCLKPAPHHTTLKHTFVTGDQELMERLMLLLEDFPLLTIDTGRAHAKSSRTASSSQKFSLFTSWKLLAPLPRHDAGTTPG